MKSCQHCGGDGENDLYPKNVCAACYGTGEVPDAWWWDDDGVLHAEGPWARDDVSAGPDVEGDDPDDRPDGFRPRRRRPKGWAAKAIKDGSIRNPALGENPPQIHSPDALVIRPPGAPAAGSSRERNQE